MQVLILIQCFLAMVGALTLVLSKIISYLKLTPLEHKLTPINRLLRDMVLFTLTASAVGSLGIVALLYADSENILFTYIFVMIIMFFTVTFFIILLEIYYSCRIKVKYKFFLEIDNECWQLVKIINKNELLLKKSNKETYFIIDNYLSIPINVKNERDDIGFIEVINFCVSEICKIMKRKKTRIKKI